MFAVLYLLLLSIKLAQCSKVQTVLEVEYVIKWAGFITNRYYYYYYYYFCGFALSANFLKEYGEC